MYIAKVISNLGAWELIKKNYPDICTEITNVITNVQPQRTKRTLEKRQSGQLLISTIDLFRQFRDQFYQKGWMQNRRKFGDDIKSGFSEIDCVKEKIGVEISLGKFAFVESDLFVKFPIFTRANIIDIAVLIMPMRLLVREMSSGVSSFEMVERRLKEITPLLPKYPFVMIGISHEPSHLDVQELTSPLDNFLIESVGYSFLEMRLQAERSNYDFKVQLSPDTHGTAKEICAMANNTGGGLILVGVEDSGELRGIPRHELDAIQRRIIEIGTMRCSPSPTIECIPFDVPNSVDRCLLVVRVSEIEQKPCMTNEKVYVRVGTMARAANSVEIRRLLLRNIEA